MKKRTMTLVISLLLVALVAVGGTLAWLMDSTQTVTNTFTVGDVNIELTETDAVKDENGNDISKTFEIIPGTNLTKDPTATVLANSEACYLFVKVDENNWPQFKEKDGTTLKIKYDIDSTWKQLADADNNVVTGVYYKEVAASTVDQDFTILKDNKVYVSGNLTKEEMEQITTAPTLAFTAYAVQKENLTAIDAWNAVK